MTTRARQLGKSNYAAPFAGGGVRFFNQASWNAPRKAGLPYFETGRNWEKLGRTGATQFIFVSGAHRRRRSTGFLASPWSRDEKGTDRENRAVLAFGDNQRNPYFMRVSRIFNRPKIRLAIRTTRLRRPRDRRHSSLDVTRVHRISPNVRDDGRRPSFGRDGRSCRRDLPVGLSEIFFGRGLDRDFADLPVGQISGECDVVIAIGEGYAPLACNLHARSAVPLHKNTRESASGPILTFASLLSSYFCEC